MNLNKDGYSVLPTQMTQQGLLLKLSGTAWAAWGRRVNDRD